MSETTSSSIGHCPVVAPRRLKEGDCVKVIGPPHSSTSNPSSPLASLDEKYNQGIITRVGTSDYGGWYEIDCGAYLQYRRRNALDLVTDVDTSNRIQHQVSAMNQVGRVLTNKLQQRERERMRHRERVARREASFNAPLASQKLLRSRSHTTTSSLEECEKVIPRETVGVSDSSTCAAALNMPDTSVSITTKPQVSNDRPVEKTADVTVAHILVAAASPEEIKNRKAKLTSRDSSSIVPALVTPSASSGCKRQGSDMHRSASVNLPVEPASKKVNRNCMTREAAPAVSSDYFSSSLERRIEAKPIFEFPPPHQQLASQSPYASPPVPSQFQIVKSAFRPPEPPALTMKSATLSDSSSSMHHNHHLVTSPPPAFESNNSNSIQSQLEYLNHQLIHVQNRIQHQQRCINAQFSSSHQFNGPYPFQLQPYSQHPPYHSFPSSSSGFVSLNGSNNGSSSSSACNFAAATLCSPPPSLHSYQSQMAQQTRIPLSQFAASSLMPYQPRV